MDGLKITLILPQEMRAVPKPRNYAVAPPTRKQLRHTTPSLLASYAVSFAPRAISPRLAPIGDLVFPVSKGAGEANCNRTVFAIIRERVGSKRDRILDVSAIAIRAGGHTRLD